MSTLRFGMATAIGPGSTSCAFAPSGFFRFAAPSLFPGATASRQPSDLLKFPLLHLDDWKTWSRWFDAAGVADADVPHGPVLNRASMLIDAAVDGQGIALARTALAAWDLIDGRLSAVRGVLEVVQHLLDRLSEGDVELPKIATFREWLLARRQKTRAASKLLAS